MKNLISSIPRAWLAAALTAAFAVCAGAFWLRGYVCALSYHEQLQMFLLDFGYVAEFLSVPGGGADVVSEFLVQLYFYPFAGVVIIALTLVAVQLMTWNAMRRFGAGWERYPLSLVPALLLWQCLGNANVLLSLAVAVLAAQCASWGYSRVRNDAARWAWTAVMMPVLYWLIGPAVAVCVVLDAADDFRRRGNTGGAWLQTAVRAILALASVLASQYVVQYPLARLMAGLNYFRFPLMVPWTQYAVQLGAAFCPILFAIRPELTALKGTAAKWIVAVETAAVAVFGCVFVPTGFDKNTYELLDYDYLVRTAQWEKIIAKANAKQPSAPLSVASLNLALAQTGQLAENMFAYYQNGTEGLLPGFTRDFISPLSTAEAFLHLGMVNTAQRFYFEAQEAIPNYRKSTRMTKRLAETNIVNGQYAVAAKYLRMLKKTLCYRSWAERGETMLYNDNAVNTDPLYSRLRKLRYTKDFLYSDREMDQMLGLLFTHNHDNRMAYEYLMAYELLNRDLERFIKYYPLGKYAGYRRIPTSYQEALVFIWTQTHRNFDGMPWSIERQTMNAIAEYAQRFSANKNDPMLNTGWLGRSYWHYFFQLKQQN